MNLMQEDELRRKALAFHAEICGTVTQAGGTAGPGVIPAPGPGPSAAGAGAEGKKIASNPAATRAPEAQGRGPTGPQPARTKPNKRENEFMMNLMVLRNTLRTNAPACRERAERAGPGIWDDIQAMLEAVDRIQNGMLATMPESRDDYYTAYARHGHYELHIDGPVRTARHLLVTDKHLAAMAEAAMKSECILCMREGSEIGQCPLREALLETAAPTDLQPDGLIRKCEYRDAAGALIQGKDVTV